MKILECLYKIWLKVRVYWSNFINKDNLVNTKIQGIYSFINVGFDLRQIGTQLDRKFNYKYDSPLHFFDDMRYPAQCYEDAINGGLLEDDCDGFHAACYHVAQKYVDSYILTYITKNLINSHTVLVCQREGRWYLLDYTTVFVGDSIDQILSNITSYRRSSPIVCWNLIKFDYTKGKYYIV